MNKALRKLRKVAIVPAFAWVFVQLLMTGVLAPVNAQGLSAEAQLSIEICATDGIKTITPDSAPTAPNDSSHSSCEWCQTFGNSAPVGGPCHFAAVFFDHEKPIFHASGNELALSFFTDSVNAIRAPPL